MIIQDSQGHVSHLVPEIIIEHPKKSNLQLVNDGILKSRLVIIFKIFKDEVMKNS